MRPYDERLRSVVEQWLSKAEADLNAAVALCKGPEPFRNVIAFHCQQAVEKFIQGILVWQQVEFPKIHDMDALVDRIATVDFELADALTDARALTPYAVQIRYPNDIADVLLRTRKLVLDRLGT